MKGKEKHPNDPNPDPIERLEKINKVWAYRRDGKPFAWIAEEMSMSSATAYKLYKEGLMMQAPQAAEEERILAIQQLDQLYMDAREAYDQIVEPLEKLKALELMNKLLKSRRELLGLDAPTKFQGVIHNVDAAELELAQMIERMKREDDERAADLRAGGAPRTRRRRPT